MPKCCNTCTPSSDTSGRDDQRVTLQESSLAECPVCGSKMAKALLQQHADGCFKEHPLQADAPGDQSPTAEPSLQPCMPPDKPGCLTPKTTSSLQTQTESVHSDAATQKLDPALRAASRNNAPKPDSQAADQESSQHTPSNAFAVMLTAQRQLSQVTA